MSLVIREGAAADAGLVFSLVMALAEYEKLAHEVTAKEDDFAAAIENGHAQVLIAEWEGEACGLALYFHNFSTFLGRRGIYLEDLFVKESHRGKGIGKALLERLAQIATANGFGRLEWAVLDWDAPSIAFYDSLGARPMKEWIVYRPAGGARSSVAAAGT